jgi:hypothetical protein
MIVAQLLRFPFMPTTLKVYTNEDDALLFWSIAKPIRECRGFAIERKITRHGDAAETADFLMNRTVSQAKPFPRRLTGGQSPNPPLNGLSSDSIGPITTQIQGTQYPTGSFQPYVALRATWSN